MNELVTFILHILMAVFGGKSMFRQSFAYSACGYILHGLLFRQPNRAEICIFAYMSGMWFSENALRILACKVRIKIAQLHFRILN